MSNWRENIATMVLVKHIWPHHFPEIGANEEYSCCRKRSRNIIKCY